MSVGVLLVKVAGIELGLLESLDLHQLFLRCSVPDSARVGLAVQGLQELPHYRYSTVIKEAFVGRGSYVYLAVVAFELALEICGFDDIKLPD
eukprot:6182954-Pleurochrysis_carterae.AAC.1